uniref:Uncharacterized protein n=1 Tax=Avena sativa TaxID=4498 RepID=A0ACD5V8C5_AVESA
MPMQVQMLLHRHLNPAFALPFPPRSPSPSSASPRRPPARPHSAGAAALGTRSRTPTAASPRRPPMAVGETGASAGTSVENQAAEAIQAFMPDARAYWVTSSLIAWNVSDQEASSICLYASRGATLHLSPENHGDIQGYDSKVELQPEHAGLPESVTQKFPFISSYRAFRVPSSVDVTSLVKCQLVVASFSADGKHTDVTGLQLPGVLDDMFAYTGQLGAVFSEEAVSLHLWAPTAQEVSVCFFDSPVGPVLETLQLKELNGVWSITGPRDWENRYYLYEVNVYHPSKAQVEKVLADDPYARGLSANGERTWLVDINCETMKPPSWDELADEKPKLDSFSDITIYELHIRDFSAHDSTVDCNSRGGFQAFTYQDSAGMQHLQKLSDAGLTHVHLLPSFHFAGVDDIKSNWKCADECELAKFPPGSDMQQAAIAAIKEEDPYNWGYNPVLWGVPKGSYASNPDGPSRIIEYRQMVQALNRIGLRVVMDVVYNHLNSSGPSGITSVLDKIVPGYYVRRDTKGQIENSAAMNNTASEHFMVDRLIVDDLVNWAVNYKGIPFFHAGDEILRSKSIDRDSYNSGDWFNKLDFTYETNNWGVGLPPSEKNEDNWPVIKPRLENPSFKPAKGHILAVLDSFVDILKIRYSSPLFRLSTASDIKQRVHFHNTGPSAIPGVIVMSIVDARNDRPEMAQLDANFCYVVSIFNVCPHEVSMDIPALASMELELHPVQANSSDPLVRQSTYKAETGRFTVPRRTASVFVEPRR